jgi:hypothetical protein
MGRGAQIGDRYGRLEVVSIHPVSHVYRRQHHRRFVCICDCGNTHLALGKNLRGGQVKSCGCLHIDGSLKETHGDGAKPHRAPEYVCWTGMKQRCLNPNHDSYPRYGGRGISVCERWLDSYETFLEDMGRKPTPAHSIDRKENDGNYEPGNCRWATGVEQQANRG